MIFGNLIEFMAWKELRMPVRDLLDTTAGMDPNIALNETPPSGLEAQGFYA